jgi:hypothetical protein
MTNKRWQDWINVILGVWLFVSPWLLRYSDLSAASWNAWILGVAIVVFAAIAVSMPQQWEEAINVLLGIWMVISPWVLSFTGARNAEANAVVVGVLVIAFAAWAMAIARQTLEAGKRPT